MRNMLHATKCVMCYMTQNAWDIAWHKMCNVLHDTKCETCYMTQNAWYIKYEAKTCFEQGKIDGNSGVKCHLHHRSGLEPPASGSTSHLQAVSRFYVQHFRLQIYNSTISSPPLLCWAISRKVSVPHRQFTSLQKALNQRNPLSLFASESDNNCPNNGPKRPTAPISCFPFPISIV